MSKENRPAKNGFLLYKTQWEPIFELEDEDLGMLMRAIFEYQIEGTEPPKKSPIAAYFKFFKAQFSIDEGGYAEVVEKRRLAGIASAEKKRLEKERQQEATKSTHVESVEQNQHKATKSTDKDKDNGKDKENDKVNDNGNELSNESFGAREVKIEDIGGFATKTEAFIQAFGSAGNRYKTEAAYKNAVLRLKMDGKTERQAHDHLIDQAAKDRRFCIQISRKRRDPDKWLNEGDWSKNYDQELQNHKDSQENKTAKGGLSNGNTTRKDAAQQYTDAAIRHSNESGL